MTFLRSLSSALGRLSERTQGQGQDVERTDLVPNRRTGGHFAALAQSHANQGINPLGFGR
jgi:hypothetical protein